MVLWFEFKWSHVKTGIYMYPQTESWSECFYTARSRSRWRLSSFHVFLLKSEENAKIYLKIYLINVNKELNNSR